MQKPRRLTVKEYVSELKKFGSITDRVQINWENKNDTLCSRSIIFDNLGIVKDLDKSFIASQRYNFSEDGVYGYVHSYILYYAYFPSNPDHADIFSRSDVLFDGPQDMFPGSVAVLKIYYSSIAPEIDYLQNCYKMSENFPELNRALASRYGGAPRHLLKMFFEEFSKIDIFLTSPDKEINPRLDKLLGEIAPKFDFERARSGVFSQKWKKKSQTALRGN